MKKFLAILLAVVLCLSVCSISVFAAGEDIVVSAKGGTAARGQEIKVPISLDSNAGWRALDIRVAYDDAVLEIACPNHVDGKNCTGPRKPSVTTKSDFEMAEAYGCANSAAAAPSHTANPFPLMWAYATIEEDITETGEYAVITFKVKDNAAFGDTTVDVTVNLVSNCEGAAPTAAAVDAKITVACTSHKAGEVKVTKEATCEEKGSKTTYCADCNAEMATEEIPAKGHDWGNWEGSADAKCGEQGEEKRVCKNDATHVETRKTDALEHLWDEGTVVTEATCEADGKKVYKCTRNDCDGSKEEVLPKLGHDYGEYVTTKEATCTEDGVATSTCANDPTHVKTEVIPALGHTADPDSWTVTKEPTLTEEGEREGGKCTVCGADLGKETMPKLTTVIDGDKVVGGILTDEGFEDADIDAKFETTEDKPFNGYVEGGVIMVPGSAIDKEMSEVDGKKVIEGYVTYLADADSGAAIGDAEVKVSIKLSADVAKYENLAVYTVKTDDAGKEYLALLENAKVVDGYVVFTAAADDLAEMAITIAGTEIVVEDDKTEDDKTEDESPKTGETTAIAFAIVMLAIAASAVVVTRKVRA